MYADAASRMMSTSSSTSASVTCASVMLRAWSRADRVGAVRELPVRPDEVARVAVGVLLEVVLVLGFGFPEGPRRGDLGDDLAGPDAGGVDVLDRVFGDRALLVVRVEDRRPVAGADVVALAVHRRGIVDLEEELEQVAVGDPVGVDRDL